MRIHDVLNKVLLLIGESEQAALSLNKDEEGESWRRLHEHVLFIIRTGQVYRFEDFLKGVAPTRPPFVLPGGQASASQQDLDFLRRAHDEATDLERKHSVVVLAHMLHFIAETGQTSAFDEYLQNYYTDAPWAIAWFETYAAAEAWLNSLAEPPSWAHVLIGDEYHEVWYSREDNERKLRRDDVMEHFLEDFIKKGLPSPVASFTTLEEAREGLTPSTAAPMASVTVAGVYYLAVYHAKLHRYSFHPLSSIKKGKPHDHN